MSSLFVVVWESAGFKVLHRRLGVEFRAFLMREWPRLVGALARSWRRVYAACIQLRYAIDERDSRCANS